MSGVDPAVISDKAAAELASVLLDLHERVEDRGQRMVVFRRLAGLVDEELPATVSSLGCECPKCGKRRRHDVSRTAMEGEAVEARLELEERERALRLRSPEGQRALAAAMISREDARNEKLAEMEKERRRELREMKLAFEARHPLVDDDVHEAVVFIGIPEGS